MQIDFVIPWVDGSDPQWIARRSQYAANPEDWDESRFRDWGILPYWFRAVEQYAPWVHRIYFITWGHIPPWLNREHPKLRIVRHSDYIPEKYLPTFSSHTIELNLHRIEDLSEHFVYFNDDMFLNRKVTPEDFFYRELPRDCAILEAPLPLEDKDAFIHAQNNVITYLNSRFRKNAVLKRNPRLWFHPQYGKYNLKNLIHSPGKAFTGIKSFHLPSSMLKSTYEALWKQESELLDTTCSHKFRDIRDVNQYIMTFYNLCSGHFHPRSPNIGKCYGIERDNDALHRDILQGTHKAICINDHPGIANFAEEKEKLIAVFQHRYPNKSTYER